MRITRRQLRRIIKEEMKRTRPSRRRRSSRRRLRENSHITPEAWAKQNGLGIEHDNQGQKIIYLSNEEAGVLSLPDDVTWTAEQSYDEESWIVYTGEYAE